MITRKHLFLAIAATCLLTMLITVLPIRSETFGVYNPWYDVNDDNKIDGKDVALVCLDFGTGANGNNINKTELLIDVNNTFTELLNTINGCNSSLIDLSDRVAYLEANLATNDSVTFLSSRIDSLNATLLDIQSQLTSLLALNASISGIKDNVTILTGRVDTLNASLLGVQSNFTLLQGRVAALETAMSQLQGAVTILQSNIASLNSTVAFLSTTINNMNATFTQQINALNGTLTSLLGRVSALEANYSSNAIPSNSSYTYYSAATSEAYSWIDMPYMSVTLAVNRTSNLLILFSTDAYCTTGTTENTYIYIQAMVNSSTAYPNSVTLTPAVQVTGSPVLSPHSHYLSNGAYSYNFNMPSVSPGSYTIKIQWHVSYASTIGTAYVGYRTLTVIALPS